MIDPKEIMLNVTYAMEHLSGVQPRDFTIREIGHNETKEYAWIVTVTFAGPKTDLDSDLSVRKVMIALDADGQFIGYEEVSMEPETPVPPSVQSAFTVRKTPHVPYFMEKEHLSVQQCLDRKVCPYCGTHLVISDGGSNRIDLSCPTDNAHWTVPKGE